MIEGLVTIDRIGGISGKRIYTTQINGFILEIHYPPTSKDESINLSMGVSNVFSTNKPELVEKAYSVINHNTNIGKSWGRQIALIKLEGDVIIDIEIYALGDFKAIHDLFKEQDAYHDNHFISVNVILSSIRIRRNIQKEELTNGLQPSK